MIAYDQPFSAATRALQARYAAQSQPIDPAQWLARPWWRRTAENAVQMMSPLL